MFLEQLPPRGGQKFVFSIISNDQPPLEVAAENVEVRSTSSSERLWLVAWDIRATSRNRDFKMPRRRRRLKRDTNFSI